MEVNRIILYQFCLQYIQSAARDVTQVKLVGGNSLFKKLVLQLINFYLKYVIKKYKLSERRSLKYFYIVESD